MSSNDEDTSTTRDSEFVSAIERGLAVITAFDGENPSLTLSAVAEKTGMTRATARRCLHTLAVLGYVRLRDRQFSLTPKALELGYSYLAGLSLPEMALPEMQALTRDLAVSTSLVTLDGDHSVYVARVATRRYLNVTIDVGTRMDAHLTATGRTLLAWQEPEVIEDYLSRVALRPLTTHTITDPAQFRTLLARVREEGYSILDQELELGIRAIAAPVFDRDGTVCAAIGASATSDHFTIEGLTDLVLPRILELCASLTAARRATVQL